MFSCEHWEDIAHCPECQRKRERTPEERAAYVKAMLAWKPVVIEPTAEDLALREWVGARAREAGRRLRARIFAMLAK